MTTCFSAAPGIDVITTTAVLPGLGSLAINAFVVHGSEPPRFEGPDQADLEAMMSGMAPVA